MNPAVIYARYSSHAQREESIEGQIRECAEFAAKHGYTIVGEYIDKALSGKTDKRPSFQKLIRDSEKGRFVAVIMYTLDRFARNRYDSAMYKAKLKKNGVKVFYAKQSIPDTPEGIILESVLEGYAEYYSENLSRNIKRGMKENALQGISTGAGVCLGYRIGADRRYEIEPVEAKTVREVYQLYADGMSATQIINYCNEQGYKTRTGRAFNKNSLRTVLLNRKYIGEYKYGDVIIPGGIPAIIEESLFEKVQAMFKHNRQARARPKAKEDYLLSTKLFCGHCNSPMIGESGTSKTGKLYHYYKCSGRKIKHSCNKAVEKKDWIEETVVLYTREEILTDAKIDFIAEQAMRVIEKELADTSLLAGLQDSLKDIDKKLKNILSAIEQGVVTSTTKSSLTELENERMEIEERILCEEMKKPLLTKESIVHWLNSFKSGDIDDIEYRRRVIDTLVNKVVVFDTNGGKGRKILLTFNLTEHNTATISCSDIACSAPPKGANPNSLFFVKHVFGFVLEIEGVG